MAVTGLTRLSDKEQRQFDKDGYIFPIGVFERGEAERYLASFTDYQSQNQARLEALSPKDKYQVFSETHYVLHRVYEIVSHPKVLGAIESLLGPNLLVWATDWFVKMPGEKTYVSMHQDGTYWNLRPANVVTALYRDEEGATLVEYILLAVLIGVAAITGMTLLGKSTSNKMNNIGDAVG